MGDLLCPRSIWVSNLVMCVVGDVVLDFAMTDSSLQNLWGHSSHLQYDELNQDQDLIGLEIWHSWIPPFHCPFLRNRHESPLINVSVMVLGTPCTWGLEDSEEKSILQSSTIITPVRHLTQRSSWISSLLTSSGPSHPLTLGSHRQTSS